MIDDYEVGTSLTWKIGAPITYTATKMPDGQWKCEAQGLRPARRGEREFLIKPWAWIWSTLDRSETYGITVTRPAN